MKSILGAQDPRAKISRQAYIINWKIPYYEAEIAAYEQLQNRYDICPKFLGHIMEEGRTVGFILEKIPSTQHATAKDLELYQVALSKLHSLRSNMTRPTNTIS